MTKDYNGDISYFQDQLTAKGISKSKLDMSDYIGLTKDELQSIVNNYQHFIRPDASDKIEFLKSINTTIPENFTKKSYIATLNIWKCFRNIDTPTTIAIFDFISAYDLDELFNLFKCVEQEYLNTYTGCKSFGRHHFWDDRRHSGDNIFKAFATIAEEIIDSDIFHERHFQEMLMEEFDKIYS